MTVLSKSTKIKLALLLTGISTTFVPLGYLTGAEWTTFMIWVFGTYTLGNVAADVSHKYEPKK